ncbi:MAG: methionine adenosyltransferase domain-containing protein, partial [bacterium]
QEGRTLTDGEIGEITKKLFDLRPYKIVDRFNLKKPIFLSTASYGHFGKEAYEKEVQLASGSEKVTFFGWEKLDRVSDIKKEFDIS